MIDILLKLTATAALVGILIVIALSTKKLNACINDMEGSIEEMESHLRALAAAVYQGELIVSFPNTYEPLGSRWTNPVYIKSA